MLAEREREWNGLRTELSSELERVRGELENSQTQCQLLTDTNEKVSGMCGYTPVINWFDIMI